MQFLSQLINTGMETHINLMPTVSYTTETAISTMYPKTRNCYDNGEANLTYLPISSGFKYSLNNCIINEMIRYIIWNCKCIPAFAPLWIGETMEFGNCTGEKLDCANKRMKSIAEWAIQIQLLNLVLYTP